MLRELKKSVFLDLSKKAVLAAKEEDNELKRIWNLSMDTISGCEDHFNNSVLTEESSLRVRLLICAEVYFLEQVVRSLFKENSGWSILDIGDSDGSTRLLLKASLGVDFESLGVNLQQKAVAKMRARGLKGECVDAMDLGKSKSKYDIVSLFETMEHLPDPVGFLRSIRNIVGQRLVISVPLLNRSRVGLRYLDSDWPADKAATIENVHVFELCPSDWERLFRHSGWRVDREWKIRHYPSRGLLKHIMQFAWRRISFEGFWFVSLKRESAFESKFRIE